MHACVRVYVRGWVGGWVNAWVGACMRVNALLDRALLHAFVRVWVQSDTPSENTFRRHMRCDSENHDIFQFMSSG